MDLADRPPVQCRGMNDEHTVAQGVATPAGQTSVDLHPRFIGHSEHKVSKSSRSQGNLEQERAEEGNWQASIVGCKCCEDGFNQWAALCFDGDPRIWGLPIFRAR
jgi:hypothetical protein